MIATPIPREMLLHVAKSLPAAPRILAELGHLLLDPNSEMDAIVTLLRRDAALTARIIRISNSAFYNTGHPYASLEEALARVGFMEVYRLTGFAAVSQIADKPLPLYQVSGAQVRENSLLTALIIELLAPQVGVDPRLAYTAGLLRSVGKIVLDGVTRNSAYKGVYQSQFGAVGDWETGFLGMSNCEAAAVVLHEWRFPTTTIEGIREHYLGSPNASVLPQLLNLAAGLAEKAGDRLPGETDYWTRCPPTIGEFECTEDVLAPLVERAVEAFTAVRAAVA